MLTERHLDGLISDANATLELLTTLSNSFQSVEEQTTTFQSQCEELLTEQRRLEKLADEVGTDLRYYAYLETATRRLNAPGASRLVDDSSFGDMMEEIESCISFMAFHVSENWGLSFFSSNQSIDTTMARKTTENETHTWPVTRHYSPKLSISLTLGSLLTWKKCLQILHDNWLPQHPTLPDTL